MVKRDDKLALSKQQDQLEQQARLKKQQQQQQQQQTSVVNAGLDKVGNPRVIEQTRSPSLRRILPHPPLQE